MIKISYNATLKCGDTVYYIDVDQGIIYQDVIANVSSELKNGEEHTYYSLNSSTILYYDKDWFYDSKRKAKKALRKELNLKIHNLKLLLHKIKLIKNK